LPRCWCKFLLLGWQRRSNDSAPEPAYRKQRRGAGLFGLLRLIRSLVTSNISVLIERLNIN
jgi:hypothetical protein